MGKNRLRTKLLPVLIIVLIVVVNPSGQSQYSGEESSSTREQQAHKQGKALRGRSEIYQESALRRFEIVTLIALPFTSIHSFLAVRGIEMIRQNKVAPELSSTDFKIIGASAVSLALFIGFWDWLHTHDKKPSQQLIPTSPLPTPSRRDMSANDWELDEPPGLVVPLVHFRF